MKKWIALLLVLMLPVMLATGCKKNVNKLDEIKKNGKIVMATSPDFAPSEFIDHTKSGQDQYVGADIELGRYIAQELGVELVIEPMDFDACQAAVSTGKVDMSISGYAYTPDRAENMLLSDFYNIDPRPNTQGLLVLKENAAQYTKPEDFAGKTIAAQSGSLQYNLVTEQLPKDIKIEKITKLNDAILMLTKGKVDAVAVATDNGEAFISNYPELSMAECYFDWSGEGNVICFTKGQDDLAAAINAILKDVNEKDIYKVWEDDAKQLAKDLGIEIDE